MQHFVAFNKKSLRHKREQANASKKALLSRQTQLLKPPNQCRYQGADP
jgi:hypothetical protein